MANNYRVPKPETVGLIVSGLKAFYGDVYSTIAKSVSSGFEMYLFTPRMTKPDFDFVLEKIFGREYAIERVVQEYVKSWLEYYAGATEGVAPPEAPSATVPENLDELVAQFEENQKSTESGLQKEQNKKDFLRKIQELSEENLKENIEPIRTTEAPPPETPTAEAFQEGELAVQVSPLSKPTVFTPSHYSVNAGITAISDANPQAATATFFLSQGISPEIFQETADKKPLTSPQKKSVEGFVRTMKEIQRSSPVLRKLIIRRSPEIRTFNIFANIGELQQAGISQGEIVRLASSNIDIDGASTPTFSAPQGFLKRWAENIGGQLFPAIFRRGPERALTRAGIKLFGKAGGRAVQKATGKAILSKAGAVLGPEGWIASEIIVRSASFLKKHWKKVIAVLTGIVIAPFVGLLGGVVVAGGIWLGLNAIVGGSAGFTSAVGSLVVIPSFIFSSLLLPSLAAPLLSALIGIPVIVALILFIINSGAYIVPPKPFSEIPFSDIVDCSEEKGDIPYSNTTTSPIAKRGWGIVADLYQGFWCYWNRSPGDFETDITLYPPSYPELFDEALFKRNPNPSREEISVCGNCMFWCTYLIQKSYRENGKNILATLWSPTMQDDFDRRGKFIPAEEATPQNVSPGAVVFFKIVPGPDRTNHVGLVHSVYEDGITYVQSNAPTKNGSLSFNSSGKGLQSMPGIIVVGIGNP